jgi:hypothetical protein
MQPLDSHAQNFRLASKFHPHKSDFHMFATYLLKYEIYCHYKQFENTSPNAQRLGFTANFGPDRLMICTYKAPFFSRVPFGPHPVLRPHTIESRFQKWTHKWNDNNSYFDFAELCATFVSFVRAMWIDSRTVLKSGSLVQL